MSSSGTAADSEIEIRPIRASEEFQASVALQKEVWGDDFTEVIPVSVLKVVQQVAGIAIGAFASRRMVGLLFGISGIRDHRLAHWSDTLAVHPAFRDLGIGRRLKCYQREVLLAKGVDRIHWTFDPLESRNAYVNFARLGVVAHEYHRDFYGATASVLHDGLETDRLVVLWEIKSDRVVRRLAHGRPSTEPIRASAPLINSWRSTTSGPVPRGADLGISAPLVRLAIPLDIQELKAREPSAASEWRRTTREAFESYLARGYTATDFVRGEECSYYILDSAGSATVAEVKPA